MNVYQLSCRSVFSSTDEWADFKLKVDAFIQDNGIQQVQQTPVTVLLRCTPEDIIAMKLKFPELTLGEYRDPFSSEIK
jgi:hypothetical protein